MTSTLVPLAVVRPVSWNLPLFLHVLGAITLVGAISTVLILAAAAGRRPERELLSRYAFRVMLVLVLPAWLLTRIGAQWTESRPRTWATPTQRGSASGTSPATVGLLLLLIATGLAWWWSRRRGEGVQRVLCSGSAASTSSRSPSRGGRCRRRSAIRPHA